MGLVDKITEDRDKRLLDQSAEELARQREEEDRTQRCLLIVTASLQARASTLDEPLEEVDEALGLPKYFVLGGVVVSVQMFTSPTKEVRPDPDQPELVAAQYFLSVIGADKRSETTIESIRVGTLKWLDYEGLYKAISNAPSYLDFDQGKVLPRVKHQM